MKLPVLGLAILAGAAHAQPTVEEGSPEAAMVAMLEEAGCTADQDAMFAALMDQGLDVDGAQAVIAAWASRGWLVWDGAQSYALGGVGECG